MSERLSPVDVSFLYLESPTTAMHVGEVGIFRLPDGVTAGDLYAALRRLVSERIALLPRYRQKVRFVPGHIANPVWVDDEAFDIGYHVRRSALPRPGTIDQLRELVGRVQSRHLDRSRPLWELYFVEGLEDGRCAILTKSHHAMVDGVDVLDIGSLILDPSPEPRPTAADGWTPQREPSTVSLLVDAVADTIRRPSEVFDTVRAGVADARALTQKAFGATAGVLAAARSSLRPAPASPLNAVVGGQRRFGMAATDLDDYKRVRAAHGGTVNDVVLATVTGALRIWLLTRGESVRPSTTVRAMVPLSVRDDAGATTGSLGSRVTSYFIDLPVGEPSPLVRLHQVSYAMKAHKESGRAVGANTMVALSGFAPPTIHSAAARLASGLTSRLFNVVVTNVPGPQYPLFAAGAQMLETYPVVPLGRGQAVSIGLTSYDGGVYFGLNGDRDAMPDVDVLAQCLEESLSELAETVR
ncbi:MAG TPA: wax ester/triacylglycerol synthase family O-acyltransferase [Mycobacteriales bacterium]|nr:wax ester/triacylglycerol synthase family O-acyltransferase [Mycobacteriales bacterium]